MKPERCDYCGELRDENHDYKRCSKFLTVIAASSSYGIGFNSFKNRSAHQHQLLIEQVRMKEKYEN